MKLKSNQAEVSPIAPMLIFGFTALLAGVLTLFLPETKNVTLPDTIKVCYRLCIHKNNFIVYSFIQFLRREKSFAEVLDSVVTLVKRNEHNLNK